MARQHERGTKIPKNVAKVFSGLHSKAYRLTSGRLGGKMAGGQIVLLGTTGAKSGKTRTTPLIALGYEGGWAVVASFSGHDTHPGWYHNLRANSSATVTVGSVSTSVRSSDAEGELRDQLWAHFVDVYEDYEKYERATDRKIPIVLLQRLD